MRPRGQPVFDRQPAMLIQAGAQDRPVWSEERFLFIILQWPRIHEGQLLIEQSYVPRDANVVRHSIGQPQQIIRAARTETGAGLRVPPVLNISLRELPACGAQDVFAGNGGQNVNKGQHVLQLIAKTIGSARLVEARAPPDPTAKRLVEQPPVQEQVHRELGRFDAQSPGQPVPPGGGSPQRLLHFDALVVSIDQTLNLGHRLGLPQETDDFGALSWGKIEDCLQGGTWIQPCSSPRREPLPLHGSWSGQGSVTSDEGGTVSRVAPWLREDRREGDPPAVVRMITIAGEHRFGLDVPAGHDVHLRILTRLAKCPFKVERY